MKNKKGLSGLGWLIIAIVVIAVAVGVYFLVSGDAGSLGSLAGSSVPQPPALPN